MKPSSLTVRTSRCARRDKVGEKNLSTTRLAGKKCIVRKNGTVDEVDAGAGDERLAAKLGW